MDEKDTPGDAQGVLQIAKCCATCRFSSWPWNRSREGMCCVYADSERPKKPRSLWPPVGLVAHDIKNEVHLVTAATQAWKNTPGKRKGSLESYLAKALKWWRMSVKLYEWEKRNTGRRIHKVTKCGRHEEGKTRERGARWIVQRSKS